MFRKKKQGMKNYVYFIAMTENVEKERTERLTRWVDYIYCTLFGGV